MAARRKSLPLWCKEAKKALIDNDMSVTDLSKEVGLCREYVSSVVNGRTYAPEIADKIGKALNLQINYCSSLF